MKKGIFSILFIISVLGVFSGILFHIKWLDYVCKPMIMVSIAGYFLLNSKNIDKSVINFALFAFLFSLIGDSFLMFTKNGILFFLLGLSSFLLAQIFYIYLFQQTIKIEEGKSFLQIKPLFLIGYFVYGAIVYSLLFNQLDTSLKIAVFVYMLAIMGMSAMALNRYKVVSSLSFLMVFCGSILFVISDSLIALDKFLIPIPNDRLFVMSTYIAAQFLIMKGILKQFE